VKSIVILALAGGINYLFLKKELLKDATEKARLIVKNSSFEVQELITGPQRTSRLVEESLRNGGFSPEVIGKTLTRVLKQNPLYYGMAMAFEPGVLHDTPFSPYYYKENGSIHFLDLATGTYQYEQKAWYSRVKKTQAAGWSEPYFDEGHLFHPGSAVGVCRVALPEKQNPGSSRQFQNSAAVSPNLLCL